MPNFLANYRTKTKRPVSFKTSSGKRVRFRGKGLPPELKELKGVKLFEDAE